MTEASQQPELVALAAALRPVAERLGARLDAPAGPAKREADRLGFLRRHLHLLGDEGGERLPDEVNALGVLLVGGDADTGAIQRSVGRVERCLENVLEGYAEAQQADFAGEYTRGLELLLEIYRDFFRQAQGWLADILEVCTDPKGAAAKRGLPTTGEVEIPLALKLSAPPALATFNAWLREQKPPESGEHEVTVQLTVTEVPSSPSPEPSLKGEIQRRERQARDAAEQQAKEDSEQLVGIVGLIVFLFAVGALIYVNGWGFIIGVGIILFLWWLGRGLLRMLTDLLGGGR